MSRARRFPRLTANDVLDALEARHAAATNGVIEWAFAREVPTSTGGHRNRIDALAMNCYQSKRYTVVAYEVKVSRADFLQELRKPHKSSDARALSHEFVFAVPKGMVDREEVPSFAGLVEVSATGRCVMRVRPPKTERDEWPATFLASVLRSAQRTALVDKARVHQNERARVYAEILEHHAAKGRNVPAPNANWGEWHTWARDILGHDLPGVSAAVALLNLAHGGVDRHRTDSPRLW